MPSYLEQTAILWTKSFMSTHATDVGEAVGTNQPKFELNGASGGVSRPMTGAELAHLLWVTSFGLLEWDFVGIPKR